MSNRKLWLSLTALVTLLLLPSFAHAQTQAITGRVTDRATGQPIADAQILISGIPRGARTTEDGRYRITGVPTGSIQVRAIRIGYQSEVATITVGAGATVDVNFTLVPAATRLDEVVVTATGESQRMRESGVNTGRVDTAQLKMANVTNLSDVLSSRVSGVLVQQAGGTTGSSSRVRIRGSNSITLSNTPLLLVDGVRVDNSTGSSSIAVGGQVPSRWNDINPDEIESIEVIKGPAATAMYGTAAASGVIQVRTKRGKAGRPRWTTYAEYGVLNEVGDYPANYAQIGRTPAGVRTVNCNIDNQARRLCTPTADSLVSHQPIATANPFRDGWREQFGTNVSGGSEVAQFFVSGDFEREEGVYAVNWLKKGNVRANVTSQVRSNLQLQLNVGYVSSRLRLPQNDNNSFGAISGSLLGKAFDCHPVSLNEELGPRDPACGADTLSRGYFNANHPGTRFFAINTLQNVERVLGSVNGNWQPLSWLNFITVGGIDVFGRWDQETNPPNVIETSQSRIEGYRSSNRAESRIYTFNQTGVGTYRVGDDLRLKTTLSAQWGREFFTRTDAFGAILLPGTSSLAGTSARFAVGEATEDIITIGGIAQQAIEWRDRMFLNLGVRTDKNSNFGGGFNWVIYPSAQLSWVLDEESFFPKNQFVTSLRLRGGWGRSGQRPAFRQAEQFYTPVAATLGAVSVPAITVGGAGNLNLRPELTKELEFGFDAGFFDRRVNLEFTRYAKETSDAIVTRPLAPSLGSSAGQTVNLGSVENRGYEGLLDIRAFDSDNFKLNLSINGSVTDNKVIDLGEGITPIIFGLGGNSQRLQNGYPLGAYFDRAILRYSDLNGDGIISRVNCPTYGGTANPQVVGGPACEVVLADSAEYLGTPFGRTELSVSPGLELFGWLQVRAVLNHRGGVILQNHTNFFRCGSVVNCAAIQDRNAPLADQAKAVAALMGSRAGYMEDADFWKLRELSFTANLPDRLARSVGGTAASITLAGRNLKTWTDYTGLDPELNGSANLQFNTADFLTQPAVRYWTTRVNFTF